jgi:flavorubredoxin
MDKTRQLADGLFYTGVNDRSKALFENLWPLPSGVSYNSYLIVDEKTVLIDTVDVCYSDTFLKQVSAALDGRPLDYLVVGHMEPDHAGSIRLLRQRYPDVRIVGNRHTAGMLNGYHGITSGIHQVGEGDTLDIGSRALRFYLAPMVHWPEVMFTYDPKEGTLFSADAFGTYGTLDGGILDTEMCVDRYWDEMYRYYANIVGKYGGPVQKALRKLSAIEVDMICPTHGPVWKASKEKAMDLYDRMSRYEGEPGVVILYGSMYGHTERMAETVASSLAGNGVRRVFLHHAAKSHPSYMLRDVFRYKGLLVGSPTYNGRLYPGIESVLEAIDARELKGRIFGCFGSFTWAGAAVKRLTAFGERMKWETAGVPVEQQMALDGDTYEACRALGKAMAEKLIK